jgi:hypothetical protein
VDKKKEIRPGKPAIEGSGFNKRNIAVFAFFLILSFVFWYLNSLGEDLEADIRYPVRYTNIPKDWKLNENVPRKLNLFLNGPGHSILRMKISGKHAPLRIDFSKVNYRRIQNSKSADYYIVTSNLVPNFNSQLKSVCKITSVKPDTLFLSVR